MAKEPAEALNNGKTQTQSGVVSVLQIRQPIEFVEYALALILWNTRSSVPNFNLQARAAPAAAKNYTSLLGAPDRVGHQVQQNPLQQDGVTAHPGPARRDAE